jgi:hypothetical protein
MTADVITFAQWLVNQGAGVAIALLVLWRLDKRLTTFTDTTATLTAELTKLISLLSAHDKP